jgi:hypothetical protein
MRFKNVQLLATNVTVPISTTYVDGTDFTSEQVLLAYADVASITLVVTGSSASCSKDVIFKFAAYNKVLGTWDTIDFIGMGSGMEVAANGTTRVQRTIPISNSIDRIKLLSIQNQESVGGYTVVCNAAVYVREK